MITDKYHIAYLLSKENIGSKYVQQYIVSNRYIQDDIGEVNNFKHNLENEHIHIISKHSIKYPNLLKDIYDPPILLFAKGDISLLSKPMLTIVGTRQMTEYGMWCVRYILAYIKDLNIVVVSGLAKGIDGCVHRTCIELGIPTVAVVAGGINEGYPKCNQDIYDSLEKGKGLLISEFPPGRRIVKGMFPMRNRILAGLSPVTVVIESPENGGSLITAQYALESGRDIFCIPCNIDRFALQGCNIFLERGANLLFSPEQLTHFYK